VTEQLTTIRLPNLNTLRVQITPPNAVSLSGTITLRDPREILGGFFKSLHHAAIQDALRELRMDITELTFVNSSAIRLFADWTTWLKNTPAEKRYSLKFITNAKSTWQRSCFSALLVIARDTLVIEHAA
jgi:hypothetical protein